MAADSTERNARLESMAKVLLGSALDQGVALAARAKRAGQRAGLLEVGDDEKIAATKFQSVYRMYLVRRVVATRREERRLEKLSEAKRAASALVVQGMWRRRKARKQIQRAVASIYIKEYDDKAQEYYYVNVITGETMWDKPKLLGSRDLPSPRSRARGMKFALVRLCASVP